MSKRYALLYTILILSSLLALVAGSALAAPAVQPPGPVPHPTIVSSPSPGPVPLPIEPAPQPTILDADGGGEWSHICLDEDHLNVFVRAENVLQYECTGASLYAWTELCEKKAAMGFTSDPYFGDGVSVTCGI